MKKYISTAILGAFLSVTCVSCNFLDELSPQKIELSKWLQTEEEAVQFLYGCYAHVKTCVFGNEFLAVTDMTTDDMDFNSTDVQRRQLSFLGYNNTNKYVKSMWGKFYAIVEQTNILIDNLEKNPDLSETSGESMMGEAKLIRAWAYYHLALIWGDVPLLTLPVYNIKTDNVYPQRTPVDQIYSTMIVDLLYAADVLPEKPGAVSSQVGVSYPLTLTKAAAKLMLARFYTLVGQPEDVISTLAYFATPDAVNDKFGLVTEFKYLFDTREKTAEDRRVKEVLWEIEASAETGFNNTLHREMAPSSLSDVNGQFIDGNTNGYQNYMPTYDLIKTFDPADKRYRQGYQFSNSAPDSKPHIRKGYDAAALDQNTAGPNALLLRTAEAYLLIAEAYNDLGVPETAKGFVDMVRARAGLAALPAGLTQGQMTDAILLERRHEFAHEGAYRLIDLRRTGRYKDVMLAYIQNQAELISGTDENGDEVLQKVTFTDPRTGNITSAINVPFVKTNKAWNDKFWLHPIPLDERIANPNLVVNNNWN